ncbi:MAG: hypothetical protein SVU32_06630 [Candidatus Nanohaloarchaea archaeon]|nr:hypothetical protein [Candidatus Nanohaloarchaea archaeon]
MKRRAYDDGYRFVAQGINLASYLDRDWDKMTTDEQYENLYSIRNDLDDSLMYENNVRKRLQRLASSRRGAGKQTALMEDLEEAWWHGFADRVFDADQYSSLKHETDVHADVFDRGDWYEVAADLEDLHAIDLYTTIEEDTFALYENGVIEQARLDVPDVEVDDIRVTDDDINNSVLSVELPHA